VSYAIGLTTITATLRMGTGLNKPLVNFSMFTKGIKKSQKNTTHKNDKNEGPSSLAAWSHHEHVQKEISPAVQ